MIPIPKGSNKDTSDIKNYRGIALSSLLSKVFDSCIISLNYMVLRSDDLQFAYKKSCSTIQCVSMVTEVINYYRHNGSSVYMCMLDACKAFDGVNLLTLFKTLYYREMCPIYLRLLMKIYKEQNMRIRWNNTVTDYFTISNGVKQAVICMVYSREYLYMLMTLRYWHHLEQVWLLCWNSVRVFREHMTFCSTFQKQNIWFSSVVR